MKNVSKDTLSSIANYESQTLSSQLVAAVDMGSNSFHLVLARIINQDIQILHTERKKVKLASGLDTNNVLDEHAINRGLETLKNFSQTLKGFDPAHVRIVATYTLRAATNADEFIKRAAKILPYPIEIIPGTEEARLIYQGIANHVHSYGNRLVIDIGGGSTEFIIGKDFETLALGSRNVGCVSLTERCFPNGVISNGAFKQAITIAKQEIEPIIKSYSEIGWQTCIGTSGAIQSLLDIATKNNFANQLTLSALKAIEANTIAFNNIDDIKIAGLTEERRSILCGGLAIMIAAFELLQIKSMQYSDKALREGVIYEMEDRLQHVDIRQRSIDSLCARFDVDHAQSSRVAVTAASIYSQVNGSWNLDEKEPTDLFLHWAANTHEVGLHINSSSVHTHSAYILANSPLPGFNQEQLKLLSAILRCYRKTLRPELIPELTIIKQKTMYRIVSIFRLSVLLNQKRQNDFVPSFEVNANKNMLQLTIEQEWLDNNELLHADLRSEKEQLKKIGIVLSIN